jgi:hypothetical protein
MVMAGIPRGDFGPHYRPNGSPNEAPLPRRSADAALVAPPADEQRFAQYEQRRTSEHGQGNGDNHNKILLKQRFGVISAMPLYTTGSVASRLRRGRDIVASVT